MRVPQESLHRSRVCVIFRYLRIKNPKKWHLNRINCTFYATLKFYFVQKLSKILFLSKICPKKRALFGSLLAQFSPLDKGLLFALVFVQI